MVDPPLSDDDVPGFWRALGLPGLVDVHVHFMPESVMRKVWAFFDALHDDEGRPGWTIAYREDEEARVRRLRDLGVRAFPSLVYPHKPGMAEWLNDWAAGFALATPGCVQTATFYPEAGVDRYVASALEGGARVFKVHLQVGDYDPRDPLLRPVWRRLADAGVPVVTHAGSGPHGGQFTGPEIFGEVLEAHPGLVAVIAHMGMPEYGQFLDLTLRYERVLLDTTVAFTDFTERSAPYPPALLEVLAEHPDRVALGTDFPNIPHSYAHQLAALTRLGLGEEWLRTVCHDNGARLFDLPAAAAPIGG